MIEKPPHARFIWQITVLCLVIGAGLWIVDVEPGDWDTPVAVGFLVAGTILALIAALRSGPEVIRNSLLRHRVLVGFVAIFIVISVLAAIVTPK